MVTLGPYAEIGQVGDSLTTGNEGSSGAVRLYLPLAAGMAAAFSGTSARPGAAGGGAAAPGVTTFNRGAPTWHIYGVDGLNIQAIRANLTNLPSNITHLFFEGGTNDVTNQIAPATSNTQLIGAMTDAIAQFPALQAFFYVGVACVGEMFQTVGQVSSFAGNSLLGGTVDAAIDSLMATLKASVQAQTGTNKLGQPIQFVYLDMRTTAVQLLAANRSPPWQNAGFLTVDGRHPNTGGLDAAFQTVALANMTVSP